MIEVAGLDYDSHAMHMAVTRSESFHEIPSLTLVRCPLDPSLKASLEKIEEVLMSGLNPTAFVIVEASVYIQNPRTSFGLVRVQTLLRLACERTSLRYQVLENTKWKRLAFGTSKKNKAQVFEMMRQTYGEQITDHHFSDATGMSLAGRSLLQAERETILRQVIERRSNEGTGSGNPV